ncbi:MAG: hypothetical protein IJS84_09785, partial [Spirochaetales bacterium]|nr:hypothetical protein [Spirochaetales bacterium]
ESAQEPAKEEIPAPAAEKAPETPEKAGETAPAASASQESKPQTGAAPAAAPADKGFKATVKKIGDFIMKEKLFSFGMLVCGIGLVFLIVSLIKSSSKRDDSSGFKGFDEEPQTQEEEPEKESEEPVQDTQTADEDDEFLKSLLGEDKN